MKAKETCSSSSETGTSLDESASWLTDRIQGTGFYGGDLNYQYKALQFSGCNMRLIESIRGDGSEIQHTYQPSLRNLKSVEVTKNASGDWGVWLEFSRNFDVMNETFGYFGKREYGKEDKITIFFDTYEKAKRSGTAFARVLELCGEETKEPF